MRALRLLALALSLAALPAYAEEVLVFAASSTTDVLQDVGAAFQAKTGNPVKFSFAGSSELARQILEGAPAGVFVSADAAQMDRVEKGGKVKHADRVDVASNRLVVLVAPDAPALKSFEDLAKVKKLALADPESVPAGVYAKKALTGLGVWSAVAPHVVPTLDVRAALAAVEAGRADAAIVYATDALQAKKAKTVDPREWVRGKTAQSIGAFSGEGVSYPAAPVDRPNNAAARAFVAFLRGPEGQAAFKKRGFVPLDSGIRGVPFIPQ